ncbi:DUF2690 domain-containing protein [Nesterenkonia ebinurensis]|uniref:DUF2690 domain-containing protein n=1 Tax=Nesterenkonia ebinurensis TaxID=2608252 RepID=UPI00123D9EA7|nr:DUF2690 domain-containing protein [Nesterenkonia ebinurensis]
MNHSAHDREPEEKPHPGDSVQQFAEDLNELRVRAGNPILAALSKQAKVSKSVLSDAFRGHRLPTENTTEKLVSALGEDPATWLERRQALDPRALRSSGSAESPVTAETPQAGQAAASAVPGSGERPGRKAGAERSRDSLTVLVAAAVGLMAALLGNAVWDTFARSGSNPEPVATEEQSSLSAEEDGELRRAVEDILAELREEAVAEGREEPASGVDPMNTRCHEDAVIAASEERLEGSVQVQILWSNECRAAWGRITRWDEQSMGNHVGFVIYPQTESPESENAVYREAFDVQSVYTPMLIEENVETRLCGVAYITTDDAEDEIELAPPMCI